MEELIRKIDLLVYSLKTKEKMCYVFFEKVKIDLKSNNNIIKKEALELILTSTAIRQYCDFDYKEEKLQTQIFNIAKNIKLKM